MFASLLGCVPPRVLDYTSFHSRNFSPRKDPARIESATAGELLRNGYLLIGYMDLRRNVRTCYQDNTCDSYSDPLPSHDELRREAADRGGDVLTVLEDRTVIETKNKSYCVGFTTTVVMIQNTPQTISVCNSYRTVPGKLEAKITRTLIWRHDPEAAQGEANARAIDTALKTIEAKYRSDEDKRSGHGGSLFANLKADSANAPVSAPDPLGEQIFLAIRNDDVRLLYALARDGHLQKWTDEKKRTALMVAILNDRYESARTLLAIDPGVERRDSSGLSAIHYAVARGDLPFIQEMTKQGYDVRQKNDQGASLLFFSVWNKRIDVFEWLLQQRLDPRGRTKDNVTLLSVAAVSGSEAVTKRLLELGMAVNHQDDQGFTALMGAAGEGQTGTLRLLLKAGARIQPRDRKGNDALHHAALGGKREVIELLLQAGMVIDSTNEKGLTPLIVAVVFGKQEAASYLMDRGARLTTDSITAEDMAQLLISQNQPLLLQRYVAAYPPLKVLMQRDPDWLEYAAKTSGRETIRYLVDLGAQVNRFGTSGMTPLMTASSAGNSATVRALLELKADATLKDRKNQTALKKATLQGHAQVVETLRAFGVRE